MKTKTRLFNLRLAPREWALLTRLAEREHMPRAVLLRRLIFSNEKQEARADVPQEERKTLAV